MGKMQPHYGRLYRRAIGSPVNCFRTLLEEGAAENMQHAKELQETRILLTLARN
ncbi:MAG: hypothetical protein ABR987_18270 [Terracidiphilus sp.]|jgi:hypothetical protein